MTKKSQVYLCELCGNIVEVLHQGTGELVCCNQPMKALEEKTADQGKEKHVPVITKTENSYIVTVGETLHPMDDNHYIEWVELIADGKVFREYLKPGIKPQASFPLLDAENVFAREYCTLHRFWKGA